MNASRRKPLIPGVLVAVLALGASLPACAADAKTNVVAVVNGTEITEAEVREAMDSQTKQQLYDLLNTGTQQLIQKRLVEAEAKARGISTDQVLAEIKPAPITDADIDAFYEQNKAQIQQPKEQIAGKIKTYLEQMGQQKSSQEFYSKLSDKYKVQMKLEPIRIEVAATGPAKGPESAPVTIVEFSDFECPFCSRLIPTLKQVEQKYGDKVRIVFRQYPLPFHQKAQKAAEASLCAADQGKFWEFHDALFLNQAALAVEQLKAKATELGMNAEQFNACLDSGKHVPAIQTDLKEGQAAGVSGTPAMFVNGRFISGAVPLEQITSVIDEELRRKGASAN